jgi:hypothetical protein
MDNGIVSDEKLAQGLKIAIRHINRNLYEWNVIKNTKSKFTISYTEVHGLAKNWIVRCLRSMLDPKIDEQAIQKEEYASILKDAITNTQVDQTN